MRPNGVFITQAASPYYTTKAFRGIEKTVSESGFNVVPIHNHVYTFGEWGWVIGMRDKTSAQIKEKLQTLDFEGIRTRWINKESMLLMTSFGEDLIDVHPESIEVNTIHNPVLFKYYSEGNWSLYF